jgi:gas vesicle protein
MAPERALAAARRVQSLARHGAKENAMNMHELKSQLKSIKNDLGDILPAEFTDRLLETMGLQVRRSAFRGFAAGTGIFIAGVVVGGAAALMLAPKPGLEMRSDIEDKIDNLVEKVKHLISRSESDTETASTGAGSTTRSSTTQAASDKNKTEANSPNRTGNPIHHS